MVKLRSKMQDQRFHLLITEAEMQLNEWCSERLRQNFRLLVQFDLWPLCARLLPASYRVDSHPPQPEKFSTNPSMLCSNICFIKILLISLAKINFSLPSMFPCYFHYICNLAFLLLHYFSYFGTLFAHYPNQPVLWNMTSCQNIKNSNW